MLSVEPGGRSLLKENHKLRISQPPISDGYGPFFRDFFHAQINHFPDRVVGWKDGFCFRKFSHHSVVAFHGTGGIDDSANLDRELKKRAIQSSFCPRTSEYWGTFYLISYGSPLCQILRHPDLPHHRFSSGQCKRLCHPYSGQTCSYFLQLFVYKYCKIAKNLLYLRR